MSTNIMVLFIHLALDVQIEDAFHSRGFHRGRHPRQEAVGFYVGEVLVHQAVRGNDGLVRHDSTFGKGRAVADPDVLTEDDGFGQRSDFPILVKILHIVEGRVHKLAIPRGAHVAADGDSVEAENLEVGADIDIVGAELQSRVVGNNHVGAVSEADRTIEDEGTPHGPDALLDGSIDVEVVLPDLDHPGGDWSVDDDFARQAAEGHLPIQPHRQLLRHREGKHLEVEPEGFDQVDGSDDV